MADNIKFSIVVPTYGVAKYLNESLGCLMHQTYDNFEVIVVDDASPDRSAEIAQGFVDRDDRFSLLRHQVNLGVSATRNDGIVAATGDYVLFLDPDDTYEPHLLTVLAAALSRNPVDVMIYGHTEDYRDEDGKLEYTKVFNLGSLDIEEDIFTTNDPVTIHRLVVQMERVTMLGYPWNKAFKLSVIRRNQLEFQQVKHIEDILFNCDFFDYVKSMTILADVLYHYRNQKQPRLTGGVIDDYFRLQKKRVMRIWEQQQVWKTCDFEALGILASVYFRSFQSNMVRMLEQEADDEEILAWCKEESQSEVYKELHRYLPKDSKTVAMLYQPLADGLFGTALKRAKLMQFTKRHFPGAFNRAKQIR